MKIEWEISPQDIQSTLRAIGAQKQGYIVGYSEICWASVVLHDKSGQIHALGDIAAANFLADLNYFLGQMKAREFAQERVSDANQSYGFKLEKEKNALRMKLPPYAHPTVLRFDFEQARSKMRYFGGLFIGEYLRICPALGQYVHLDALRREFNLKP